MNLTLKGNRCRQCRGMTLLEVVIALSVFTTVAFSLVMALDASFDAAQRRNEIDSALRGLENQMALLHIGRIAPTSQDLPADACGILYHIEIQPETLQSQSKQPLLGIYRATITAKWRSGNQMEDRNVSELIYQP